MRLVCISDTHGHHGEIDLPDGDVLIHAGDFSRRSTRSELEGFVSWMASLPYAHKIFVAGNHDFIFENDPDLARSLVPNDVTYLQDSSVTIEGAKIWGSPWQPWFFDWAFNLQRGSQLREKWDLIPNDTDVLITHGPPKDVCDRTVGGEHAGCEELALAVERVKPAVHIFGHIHEGYGRLGRSVNASICSVAYLPVNPPILITI